MAKTNWISIKKEVPKGKCLVTNNLKAKDNNGEMSHVWIAETGVNKVGRWYNAFINLPSPEEVYDITHWAKIPS